MRYYFVHRVGEYWRMVSDVMGRGGSMGKGAFSKFVDECPPGDHRSQTLGVNYQYITSDLRANIYKYQRAYRGRRVAQGREDPRPSELIPFLQGTRLGDAGLDSQCRRDDPVVVCRSHQRRGGYQGCSHSSNRCFVYGGLSSGSLYERWK